jgi:hypothetical protein
LLGGDVNSSNQVSSTHLAAGLPRAQGGLNSTSAGTGILRDGTTPAASELSGDATTSGTNAVTVTGTNGGAIPASTHSVYTNSAGQFVSGAAATLVMAFCNGRLRHRIKRDGAFDTIQC